jgi:beta-N-acetylhexosaminidase
MVALLLHVRHSDATSTRPRSAARLSARLSAAALTSVSGGCSGRLVGGRVRVSGPADVVAAFRTAAARQGLGVGRGVRVALVGDRPRRAGVVVALDRPDVLARSTAKVRLAAYGATPGAMHAVVAFLLGQAPAPGGLPVPVRGLPRPGC